MRQGVVLIAAGVIVGVFGAIGASRVLASMLFGVESTDPAAFGMGVLALTLPALLACYVSSRRAARVDPVRAIQSQ